MAATSDGWNHRGAGEHLISPGTERGSHYGSHQGATSEPDVSVTVLRDTYSL